MQVHVGPFDMTHQGYLTSVYGGIEFGLDRFELAQRHTLRWDDEALFVLVKMFHLHIH
jgi:hypothetical protein